MSPTTIPGNLILQSQSSNDPLLDLNTQPSLDLQFATSKTLDDRVSGQNLITFDRNSSGTYVDSQGVIQMAGHNLLTYSEELDNNVAWTNLSIVVDDNSTTDPNGNLTADLLTRSANQSLAYQLSPAAGTYVFSVYAKAGSSNFVTLGSSFIYRGSAVTFNLSTGTPGNVVNYYSGTDATIAVSNPIMTDVGNGWWRCQVNVNHTTARAVHVEPGDLTNTAASAYFWGAQLEVSGKASPYIKTTNLPSAAPRFDHDPTTNASLGLLVEESRTNEIPYSEDFTTWGLFDTGDTLTSSALTSPDGTLTGTLFAPDNTSGLHIVRQSYTFQGGTTYTLSVFVKEGGRRYMHLAAGGSALGFPSYDYRRGIFDLQTGSVNSTPLNGFADIKPFSNGWYRCSITITPPAGGAANFDLYHADTTTPTINTVTDGNGTDGIYIWGAQLEAGAFPTSYIPTSGSTVPRAADNVSITGSNFSRWYSQSEGSTLINYNAPNAIIDTDYPRLFAFNSGFATDFSAFAFNGVNNSMFVNYVTGSSTKLSVSTTLPKNSNGTAALAYQDNNSIAFLNENSSTQGRTVGPMSTILNRLDIGGDSEFSSRMLNGTIARLTYYPYRLPDSTLQTITS
jgi:hypothetical protein